MTTKINIKNRKARFEYELLETFIAGIQLQGTEIKSIRESKASIAEAYCVIIKSEFWIRSMHIAVYEKAGNYNHEPTRDRKLLLNRKEINKWEKKTKEKGLTIIPTRLFINDRGFAKVEIALAKGKKLYDKRDDLKKQDAKRQIDREIKNIK